MRMACSLRRGSGGGSNMKLINVTNLGGSILGLLLLLRVGVMASTTAQAQYPYPNQDQYRGDRDRNNVRYRNRDYDRGQDRYGQRNRGLNRDVYANYGGTYELRQ